MTKIDQMALLRRMVDLHGQAEVARSIGKSDSAISQVLNNKYKGNPDNILQLVEEIYGNTTAICPILGEISLKHCAEERKKVFSTSRARLWMACKQCPNNGGKN